jgi:hypothetical protein
MPAASRPKITKRFVTLQRLGCCDGAVNDSRERLSFLKRDLRVCSQAHACARLVFSKLAQS